MKLQHDSVGHEKIILATTENTGKHWGKGKGYEMMEFGEI
jgi:hypothetical protein